MFDCIVVGAGPAGITAAYHLAKRGHPVLLLEKATFPRYKPCGGGVSPAIQQWLDFDFTPVIETTITQVEYTWKMGEPLTTELKQVEPMWMVRRDKFDQFLLHRAQQQGVEVKENTEVTAISFKQNSWHLSTSRGDYSATYLIAADGVNGPMASWLGFKISQPYLGATLEIPASIPPEKRHRAAFDFGSLKNGYIWNFPKSDGYTLSGGCFRGSAKPEQIKKQLSNYATKLGLDSSEGNYTEYPLRVWKENYPLHTDNALLAGETAGIGDPLLGEGIRPAIFSGFQAASAISRALGGEESALASYSATMHQEWGADMVLAHRLAGLFYQFPKIAYQFGVKRPLAATIMAKILGGHLRYADVTDYAIKQLKQRLIPGFGNG